MSDDSQSSYGSSPEPPATHETYIQQRRNGKTVLREYNNTRLGYFLGRFAVYQQRLYTTISRFIHSVLYRASRLLKSVKMTSENSAERAIDWGFGPVLHFLGSILCNMVGWIHSRATKIFYIIMIIWYTSIAVKIWCLESIGGGCPKQQLGDTFQPIRRVSNYLSDRTPWDWLPGPSPDTSRTDPTGIDPYADVSEGLGRVHGMVSWVSAVNLTENLDASVLGIRGTVGDISKIKLKINRQPAPEPRAQLSTLLTSVGDELVRYAHDLDLCSVAVRAVYLRIDMDIEYIRQMLSLSDLLTFGYPPSLTSMRRSIMFDDYFDFLDKWITRLNVAIHLADTSAAAAERPKYHKGRR